MTAKPNKPNRTLGVVLAGGQSRRMGNVDKSLLKLGNKPLVQHAVNRLAPQVDCVILNTNVEPPSAFEFLDIPIIKDSITGYAGPLAGILTAMEYAAENEFEWVVSAAADTPFFPHNYVKSLKDNKENDIILAKSSGHRHPTFGLWRSALAPSLRHFLTKGTERKIMLFVQQQRWEMAEFDGPKGDELDPFFNINTPQEFQLAENALQIMEPAHE